MKDVLTYRSYEIYHDGYEYVAEPAVSDGTIFELGAKKIELLHAAIDSLWSSLDASKNNYGTATLPVWYRSWIDAGSCGRIRLDESGPHQSVAPKPWFLNRKLVASAVICAVLMCFMPTLDVNKDGSIDLEDYSALVEKAFLARPPKGSHQKIRFDNRVYDVTLMRAPEDDIDFDATGITIKPTPVGQSVSVGRSLAVD